MSRAGLNYSYIRNTEGHPVVCIASLTKEGSKTVSFQLAVHNPKDQFNKKFARAASGGRLVKHPINFVAEQADMTLPSLIYRIAKYLVNTRYEGVKIGPIGKDVIEGYIWDIDNGYYSAHHQLPKDMV